MKKVKDLMTNEVASADLNTTVAEVAQLMQKHNVGAIPVVEGEKVIGMVTDRDIVVRNVAHEKDPKNTPVQEVMTTEIQAVSPEMNLRQAAQFMAEKQVRRLPVVEEDKLVGMVSLGDLATQARHDVELARTLGEISVPSRPRKI